MTSLVVSALESSNRVTASSPSSDPTWQVALLFPRQGAWTEGDYLALDARGQRFIELCDGHLEINEMPSFLHQELVRILLFAIARWIDEAQTARSRGKVSVAPLPLRLGAERWREPDILYFKGRPPLHRGYPTAADLVVEVVTDTPDDRRRDTVVKRAEYAVAGIAEYWIVDPAPRTVVVLVLENGAYREHGVFAAGDVVEGRVLAGFRVDVEAMFAEAEAESAESDVDD